MRFSDCLEQESCINYGNGLELGFSFRVESVGEVLKDDFKSAHHVLFVIGGCLEVQFENFEKVIVERMETIFLPKSCLCHIKVMQEASLIMLSFDNNINYLSRYLFQNLYKLTLNLEYEFMVFPVRGHMGDFLHLLIGYFNDGLNESRYLHGVKQDELFVLFKSYYTNLELARFFYPIIGVDLDFKNRVLDNYLKVKTTRQLAELVRYSLAEFRRRFKENFHEPVYCWMQKQKSRHIQYELLTTNDDISTIAFRYGFSSLSHFNKYCHNQFGMSPTELRKKFKYIE